MRRHPHVLLVAFLSLAGACTSISHAAPSEPLPAPMPVVDVTMTEYHFAFTPPASGGRVMIRVTNAGRVIHALELHPLGADFPPIDQQLHGSVRRTLAPFAELPAMRPGQHRSFVVDLRPDTRYAFLCFVADRDRVVHALKGMNAEFRTAPLPSLPRPPGPGS
ncbi:MAG TPA: hypothetical protein VFJ85_07945 [Acidimicrobiales bacterium]|nr:hypothetical protein [Acidimicrobiales bacterium]